MFVFYYGGGGARGAIFSLGLSLGLCVINLVPVYLLFSLAALAFSIGGFFYRERVGQVYREWISRLWRRQQPSHFDEVLGRLRTMQTEKWRPAKDLTVSELRSRIRSKATFLERSELENAYRDAIEDMCPICAEAWSLGDVYRRLERCGHCFHIECIDKWAMTSAYKDVTGDAINFVALPPTPAAMGAFYCLSQRWSSRRIARRGLLSKGGRSRSEELPLFGSTASSSTSKRRWRPLKQRLVLLASRMLFACRWLLCCCRRRKDRRHRDENEVEDGDVEMGGAKSVLVSERVRMLERAPAQQHGDKPASEITTGVSIQERRALLERNEKRDEQRPSPSSSSRRTQSTSLNRLRSRKTITTCGACGGSLYENESETARGVVYHKSCLRCASCGRSLASVPFGKLAEDDDLLYCDENPLSRSGRSCLEKLREAGSHATAEREAKDQRLSDADKESVGLAKLRAVDLIGDDLDKIIQQMQPTCAICGYPFIASDKLVMQGMVKYHEACCYSGTAAVKRDVAISPKRALDEAPKDLLIKLKGTQQAAKTMTFFAIRRQESEGESLEAVDYLLDPASRAPNYRKADAATLVGATVRVLGTTGADLAPPTSASFSERNTLVAEFSWQGNALDWSIRATFSYVDNAVAFHSAKLSVVKLDDLNRQRSAQAKLLHPPPTFPSSK